jgi:crotonobetainyl-CoA:carnitine CoA-transferase CaiB-like acyl-CoA transferase
MLWRYLMSEQRNSGGFLSGYRVLDLTDERGLLCGKILGDFGADVIKIEPPGGDPARNIGPFYKDIPHPEKSLFWFFTNLNKRGITLNLETADGRDIFKRLVKAADFIIESFEPGYVASLGLGYDDLCQIKPDIIMTSITPYGQTGPYAHYEATDITLMGMGAMMQLFGYADRAPVRISQPQAFFLGSIHGVLGSLMAHYYRQGTGEGQQVDVSCQEAVVLTLLCFPEYWDILKYNYMREGPSQRMARPAPLGPLVRQHVYACKDGFVVGYIAGGAQAGLVASSRALTEWANGLGYAQELQDYDWTKMDFGTVPQAELNRVQDAMKPFLLSRTKAEIMEKAVDKALVMIPVANAKDIRESPQFKARDFYVPVEHPELGEVITYPGFPIKMTAFSYKPPRRAPLVGEHNEEVYIGELGLSREELARLKANGVI